MSKRIVLVKNMGNSGGAWLMKVFCLHKDILMLQELNQILRLRFEPKSLYPDMGINFDVKIAQRTEDKKGFIFNSRTQCEIACRFLLYQFKKRNEEVIGLIKCFDGETVKACRNVCDSVKVIQTIRNPIGIIDFYMSVDTLHQISFDKPYRECFEDHVHFFSSRFKDVLKCKNEEPIIRLEDLNVSLRDGTDFFKILIEDIFEVVWTPDLMMKTINLGIGGDGSQNKLIWNNWEDWKKECFLKDFEPIMKELGYA